MKAGDKVRLVSTDYTGQRECVTVEEVLDSGVVIGSIDRLDATGVFYPSDLVTVKGFITGLVPKAILLGLVTRLIYELFKLLV